MTIERLNELRRVANGLFVHAASKAFIECLDEIEILKDEHKQFFRAFNYLREGIAESLTFLQENEDPPPRHAIECSGEWTNYEARRFEADTIQNCLDMAVAAKEQAVSEAKG